MLVPDHDSEVPGRERVKLLDFGIAKVAQADDAAPGQAQPKTSTDVVMGTPRYMAPEQCKGGVQIDDKADVYSLGVMLYEMLAGRPPFVGGSGEVLAMHIYEPPQPLKTLAPHVPEEIAQLVHLLLSKKREERPNMKQVMARLEELGQRHPTSMLPAISMAALLPPSLTPPGTNPHQTPTAGTSASSTLGLSAGQAQNGRSPKMLLLGLLGGGTALLGVLAILLLRPQPKPVVTVQPVKTIPVDMASPAPPQPVAAKPKQIHWSVQTTPPGAQIVRVSDGQILGGTPMELDQSASDGSCEVKLKLPGFADKVIKLSLADNETRKETLDKAPVVRPILKPRPGIGKTTSTPSKGNDEQPRIVD